MIRPSYSKKRPGWVCALTGFYGRTAQNKQADDHFYGSQDRKTALMLYYPLGSIPKAVHRPRRENVKNRVFLRTRINAAIIKSPPGSCHSQRLRPAHQRQHGTVPSVGLSLQLVCLGDSVRPSRAENWPGSVCLHREGCWAYCKFPHVRTRQRGSAAFKELIMPQSTFCLFLILP